MKGNAIKTVGYLASGEANDYILHEFGIPSVSPELANDDFFSNDFFLPYPFVTRSVLRDNQDYIFTTMKKLAGQVLIDGSKNASYQIQPEHGYLSLNFTVQNIGLQHWYKSQDPFQVRVLGLKDDSIVAMRRLPSMKTRQSINLSVTMPKIAGDRLLAKNG